MILHCKATLGRGQCRLMRWISLWIMPLLQDRSLDLLIGSPRNNALMKYNYMWGIIFIIQYLLRYLLRRTFSSQRPNTNNFVYSWRPLSGCLSISSVFVHSQKVLHCTVSSICLVIIVRIHIRGRRLLLILTEHILSKKQKPAYSIWSTIYALWTRGKVVFFSSLLFIISFCNYSSSPISLHIPVLLTHN